MKIKDPNIRQLLSDHNFNADRSLNDYIEIFGYDFANVLKAMKPKSHWLDAGAGEGKAIREFLLATSKQDIFTTAVTLKMSSKIPSPLHKTVVNYLEELVQESIASCDVITDVEGGLQFTDQPDLLLKKYILWMKAEGKLFVYVKPGSTHVEKNGTAIEFSEWVTTIPGLTISPGSEDGTLIIAKEKATHAIPRLKLLETQLEDGLKRKFREM